MIKRLDEAFPIIFNVHWPGLMREKLHPGNQVVSNDWLKEIAWARITREILIGRQAAEGGGA